MNESDIPYLLRRAHAHRSQAAAAKCPEARLIHRRFVKNYQRLLTDIRRGQGRERDACGCCPRNADIGDCEGQGTDTAPEPRLIVGEPRIASTWETRPTPAPRCPPRPEPVDHGLMAAPRPNELEAPQPFILNVVAVTASAAVAASQSIKCSDAPAQPVAIDAAA